MSNKQDYPCGGFQELQQMPPGQEVVEQFPCIFNDIQRTQYVCPMADDKYPEYCQGVYKEIAGQIADAQAAVDTLEKKIEADKKASMTLKERFTDIMKKDKDEEV